MTVGVVDAFEVVEVDHYHRRVGVPGRWIRQTVKDRAGECPPVQQAGEGILFGALNIHSHGSRYTPNTKRHR
jgi:hypothetical protein